jgi:hypothetical protein
MAEYKVKEGFGKYKVGASIKDGREKVLVCLENATQEQLEEFYIKGPSLSQFIEKTTKGKPKKKKRDNNPGKPAPTLEDE